MLRRLQSVPRRRGARRYASDSPVSHQAYERRRPWDEPGFPAAWLERSELPLMTESRIAAVVHVFYPDLLEQILNCLTVIPVPFDLILTDATHAGVAVDASGLSSLQHHVTLPVENRGRDLWPLAQVVNAGLLDPYELIVKLHTKRSGWRDSHGSLNGSGDEWREDLLAALLGDEGNVTAILHAYASSADLGMVTSDGSVLGATFWGSDAPIARMLLQRLGLELRRQDLAFPAGSMYWSRSSILQGLRALHLRAVDFEDEQGQVDGTTAHALERVIGLLARRGGLRIVERSRLPSGQHAYEGGTDA